MQRGGGGGGGEGWRGGEEGSAIRVETTRGRRDHVPPTGAGWERVYLWMDAAASSTALWQGAHGSNPAAQSVEFVVVVGGKGGEVGLQPPLKCRKNSQ